MDEQIFRTLQPLLLGIISEPVWALITSWALPGAILVAAGFWAHRERRWKTLAVCIACGHKQCRPPKFSSAVRDEPRTQPQPR